MPSSPQVAARWRRPDRDDTVCGHRVRPDRRHFVAMGIRVRQSYLIAFIHDATRLVPHATFALTERTAAYVTAAR